MKMDIVANSKNDEFYTPRYAVNPILKYIGSAHRVWCPFDTADSLIVKAFQERGNPVKFTHLSMGNDFFGENIDCDVIVSNPPYSMKGRVFERLFALGRPFAMLVGVVGLFEGAERFRMFSQNEFEILWMSKRISYFKSFADQKPSLNPPFSSVWITSKLLPKQNVFEIIDKR